MPKSPLSPLELKVPPLLVMLLVGAAMWIAASATPQFTRDFSFAHAIAYGLLILGVAVIVSGVLAFRRAQTTVDPTKPANASSVVTDGIYRFTRNPMYLGMVLALIGWAVFLSNLLAAAIAPLFIPYLNRFQIEPEERFLHEKFGAPYAAYLRTVRRWL